VSQAAGPSSQSNAKAKTNLPARSPGKETLPSDAEAERWLLGGLLAQAELYPITRSSDLRADDFILDRNRRIFRAIEAIAAREEHIDLVTVGGALERLGELGRDGRSYLAELENGMPLSWTREVFAGLVRRVLDRSNRRRGIYAVEEFRSKCELPGETLAEILASHSAKLRELEQLCMRGREHTVKSIDDLRPPDTYGTDYGNFIHEPEIVEGMITAISGDAGSGKSTLALMYARDAIQDQRHVLILDRENPRSIVVERLGRLRIDSKSPFLHYWGGWVEPEAPDPGLPEIVDWVKRITKETGRPPFVIVDALTAFHRGDQNDAGQTRAFMDQLRRLSSAGAGVLIIHHSGKADSAKDYRGSSDFKAAVDQAFHVENHNSEQKNRLDKITLRCYKSRLGFAGELVYHYEDGAFLRDDRLDAASRIVTQKLRNLLRDHPGVAKRKFEELAQAAKITSRKNAGTFLVRGVQAGEIRFEKNPDGSGGFYTLVEPSPPAPVEDKT
jgi:KaiC/GvpD/RAD55 family RecA-like ATPase